MYFNYFFYFLPTPGYVHGLNVIVWKVHGGIVGNGFKVGKVGNVWKGLFVCIVWKVGVVNVCMGGKVWNCLSFIGNASFIETSQKSKWKINVI